MKYRTVQNVSLTLKQQIQRTEFMDLFFLISFKSAIVTSVCACHTCLPARDSDHLQWLQSTPNVVYMSLLHKSLLAALIDFFLITPQSPHSTLATLTLALSPGVQMSLLYTLADESVFLLLNPLPGKMNLLIDFDQRLGFKKGRRDFWPFKWSD